MKRIFVRGISRSGGTLMATVLDAHPQVAMCYEIYHNLLVPPDDSQEQEQAHRHIEQLRAAAKSQSQPRRSKSARIEDPDLRTFAARAERAGIQPPTLLRLLEEHVGQGCGLSSFQDRMLFIERIAKEKMQREAKEHWGVKIPGTYDQLQAMFDDAYFLFMLRDARDVASSQKLVGNFNKSPEEVAHSWQRDVLKFQKFASQPFVRARLVRYEQLAADPEPELREITEFLELTWDNRLLHFYEEDLSLYRNPKGHLSADQVNRPISTASIGRWRRDLTSEEVEAVEATAGPLLQQLGYGVSTEARAHL